MIEVTFEKNKKELRMIFKAYKRYQTLYNKCNLKTITQYYKYPSDAKIQAWEYCVDLKEKLYGRNLTVISGNSHIFTAGFTFDRLAQNKEYFAYITKSYDYMCSLDDLIKYGGEV